MADSPKTEDFTRSPRPEEDADLRQFLQWAFPTFSIMEAQAVGQMGKNVGCSGMSFALLAYAARMFLDTKREDHHEAMQVQLKCAWDYALRLKAAENGAAGNA